jgi:hypothetical protein
MRRGNTFKRSRLVGVLILGGIGCAVGWHAAWFSRSSDLTAAQIVALRFPEDIGDTSSVLTEPIASDAAVPSILASTNRPFSEETAGDSQGALIKAAVLFVPEAAPAAAAFGVSAPVHVAAVLPAKTTPPHRRSDRPGTVLNDAQIASIKRRLQLTPDQEAMWPAVEAALRTVAYAHASDARGRGAAAKASLPVDPNSTQMQELKSAAIPLLMSFSSEQKDELRSLAHVMGLDRLASQF